MCEPWKENVDKNSNMCSYISDGASPSFHVTVFSHKSYVNGRLQVYGSNLKSIDEACMTLPNEDEGPWLCQFPFNYGGKVFNHCVHSGEGQSHWCSTENSENGTTMKRGHCGPSCPIPDKEQRCITEKK